MAVGTRALVVASLATLLVFVVLDAGWLSLVAVELFRARLGDMLRPAPVVGAILAFYPIYAAGLTVLAVRPALAAGSWRTAAGLGAVLGFTAYATFDLTSLAVIERWTPGLAAVDMAWGTCASAAAALAGYAAGRWAQHRAPSAP